jgi:hypothetical protein
VGLIARTLEHAGISTVCFNLLLATPSAFVRPPRTIWLPHFPFSLQESGQKALCIHARDEWPFFLWWIGWKMVERRIPRLFSGEVSKHHLLLDALDMLATSETPGSVRCRTYTVWGEDI